MIKNEMENSFFPVPQAVRSPCARRGRRRRGEYGGHLLTERAFFGSGLLVAQVRVRRVRTLLPRVRRVGVLPRQVQPRRRVHHDPAVQLRLGRDRGGVVGVGQVLLRVQVRKEHERLLRVGVLRARNGAGFKSREEGKETRCRQAKSWLRELVLAAAGGSVQAGSRNHVTI